MATVLEIWNSALAAAEARGRVSSLTEASPEQEVCSQFYSMVVKAVQEAAWWPSSKALSRLPLISEAGTSWQDGKPEPGYAYAYGNPPDMLRPWHMTDWSPFSLSFSPALGAQVISSNLPEAVLVYARLNETPEFWTPSQTQATIYTLASHISGPLSGRQALVQRNIILAQNILEAEQAVVANMVEPDPRPAVPWFQARGLSSGMAPARYFYPFGAVLSVGATGDA